MSTSNQTHDHQAIRDWVENRNGVPARVKETGRDGDEGILRIHFPEHSNSHQLEEISWEDFFDDFDNEKLDFLYQNKKANGETSTFHKFIKREE